MATTIALVLLAAKCLRPFALVMTFAIFTGTFSSIYIAAPLLMYIEKRWPGEDARAPGRSAHGVRSAQPPPRRPSGGSGVRSKRPCDVLVRRPLPSRRCGVDPDRDGSWHARGRPVSGTSWSSVPRWQKSERGGKRLAQAHPGLSATAGVHPMRRGTGRPPTAVRLRDLHCTYPKWWRWGETGLDYHYDHSAARRTASRLRGPAHPRQ